MPRLRIDLTLPEELIAWVNEHVEAEPKFRSRSHFFEMLVREYRTKLE